MEFISVAFTIQETHELFMIIVKSNSREDALYKAIVEYGLAVPSPEKYKSNYYSESTDYIEFCKIVCNLEALAFHCLHILDQY